MRKSFGKTLLVTTLLLLPILAFSQSYDRPTKSTRAGDQRNASRYIFSPGADALLMSVQVWGEVRQPGVYEVPIGIDLITLLSSAGGPTNSAKLKQVKIISQDGEEGETLVKTVDVKEYLHSGDIDLIPEMKPGDTIVVPVRASQIIMTTLSWTQQIVYILSLYALFNMRMN